MNVRKLLCGQLMSTQEADSFSYPLSSQQPITSTNPSPYNKYYKNIDLDL